MKKVIMGLFLILASFVKSEDFIGFGRTGKIYKGDCFCSRAYRGDQMIWGIPLSGLWDFDGTTSEEAYSNKTDFVKAQSLAGIGTLSDYGTSSLVQKYLVVTQDYESVSVGLNQDLAPNNGDYTLAFWIQIMPNKLIPDWWTSNPPEEYPTASFISIMGASSTNVWAWDRIYGLALGFETGVTNKKLIAQWSSTKDDETDEGFFIADETTTQNCSEANLVLYKWQHWTVVFDRSHSKLRFYLNGVLDAEHTITYPNQKMGPVGPEDSYWIKPEDTYWSYVIQIDFGISGWPSTIQHQHSGGSYTRMLLDDFRIYRTALPQSNITDLVSAFTIPVQNTGWYRFDDSFEEDNTIFNNRLRAIGDFAFTNGAKGNAVSLNSYSGEITSNDEDMDFYAPKDDSFSLAFWTRFPSNCPNNYYEDLSEFLSYNGASSLSGDGWGIGIQANTGETPKLYTHFSDGATGFTFTVDANCSSNHIVYNTWQHWTVVFDRTASKLRYYLNGVLDIEHTVTYPTGIVGQDSTPHKTMQLGGLQPEGRDVTFDIDDLRFFKGVLTQTNVTDIYNYTP